MLMLLTGSLYFIYAVSRALFPFTPTIPVFSNTSYRSIVGFSTRTCLLFLFLYISYQFDSLLLWLLFLFSCFKLPNSFYSYMFCCLCMVAYDFVVVCCCCGTTDKRHINEMHGNSIWNCGRRTEAGAERLQKYMHAHTHSWIYTLMAVYIWYLLISCHFNHIFVEFFGSEVQQYFRLITNELFIKVISS